jgi:SAM-dependent methyltransferase
MSRSAVELAPLMAAYALSPEAQLRQTRFRIALVESFGLPEGSRVLEIGCGQGDTTAALADALGPRGRVVAVDLADPSYGAPVTIGDSAAHLSAGPLGKQIKFRYGFDVLDPQNAFPEDAFDAIVLAQCTWYFGSLAQVRATLDRIRPWAARLCLCEWDLEPRSVEQTAHLLAVLIQGQIEAFKEESLANVRTPYSREALQRMLGETSWAIASEALVDASELDDARWEIEACLGDALPAAAALGLPARLQTLLASQGDVLRRVAERDGTRPLPAYSVVAERRRPVTGAAEAAPVMSGQ